jgi:hypothetical protein
MAAIITRIGIPTLDELDDLTIAAYQRNIVKLEAGLVECKDDTKLRPKLNKKKKKLNSTIKSKEKRNQKSKEQQRKRQKTSEDCAERCDFLIDESGDLEQQVTKQKSKTVKIETTRGRGVKRKMPTAYGPSRA